MPAVRFDGTEDFVLLFHVFYHPSRVVETANGKVFVRVGDSCHELKSDEDKQQLRADKGEVRLEQEQCGLPYPDEFNLDLIKTWAANVRRERRLIKEIPDEKVMEILHLGTKKPDGTFLPNIACAMIFANDPEKVIPGCKIRFLKFDGVEEGSGAKFNAVQSEWITGSIPAQINLLSEILGGPGGQIRTFSGLGKDGTFATTPEYPKEAWLEAIVNACVHRSYTFRNMNIFVKMFDDRLVVDSPGQFPPPVTPLNIYDIQHSRNPSLTEALHYLGYTKVANEGVRRMRDTMLQLSLPAPEFLHSQTEIGGAKVRVVLRNNIAARKVWVDADVASVIGAAIAASLSVSEKQVLNFVAVHGTINISQTQRLTGHAQLTSINLLKGLEKKGILAYIRRKGMKTDVKAHYILRAKEIPPEVEIV